MVNTVSDDKLLEMAKEARLNAYAPYSNFYVGAALLCDDGSVFLGCNVESATSTPTSCAERTALFAAVANGHRKFTKIAIVGANKDRKPLGECAPCGVCRQALAEFCDKDFIIVLADDRGAPVCHTLGELLPMSFTSDSIF